MTHCKPTYWKRISVWLRALHTSVNGHSIDCMRTERHVIITRHSAAGPVRAAGEHHQHNAACINWVSRLNLLLHPSHLNFVLEIAHFSANVICLRKISRVPKSEGKRSLVHSNPPLITKLLLTYQLPVSSSTRVRVLRQSTRAQKAQMAQPHRTRPVGVFWLTGRR